MRNIVNKISSDKSVLPAGGVTVLLVDDNEVVLTATYHLLSIMGCKVIPALSPAKALSIATHSPQQLDLLMTDVVMPEMSGLKLAGHVTAYRPAIRILYFSASSKAELAGSNRDVSGLNFLKKPYDIKDLQCMLAKLFPDEQRFEKQNSL